MATKENVWYSIWPERRNLVRFTGSKAELFCPNRPEKWVEMPHLNDIRYGTGNSVWYEDDIGEEKAKEWMEIITKELCGG